MNKALLKGRIEPGMFPTEVFVSFEDADGDPVMVIVPDGWIVEKGEHRYVSVRLLETRNGVSLVHVPGEVVQGQAVVTVSTANVVPDHAPR